MLSAFRALARFRRLRGTPLDPFGWSAERKWERRLLADYEAVLHTIEKDLSTTNFDLALALAAYPRKIRGYGHVKRAQAAPALAERERLLKAFLEPESAPLAEAAE